MLSTDVRLNFHLKREILMLASEISARDTLSTEDYIITRDELRGIDIPDQNVVLQRHLDALREIRSTLEAQRPESSFSSSLTSMHGEASESHWRQRTGHLTQRCRSALLCWLIEKATDNTFQPEDSDQLLVAACAFLKWEVLTAAQELSTRYARPARFSRLITHPDNLWSAFQHLRSVPAGEPNALSIKHLSTKPSRGYA
jgi:hypothetical protein